MKQIEIKEEFQIPGTEIILEAGDTIGISEQKRIDENRQSIVNSLISQYIEQESDITSAAEYFGSEIYQGVKDVINNPALERNFYRTLAEYLS